MVSDQGQALGAGRSRLVHTRICSSAHAGLVLDFRTVPVLDRIGVAVMITKRRCEREAFRIRIEAFHWLDVRDRADWNDRYAEAELAQEEASTRLQEADWYIRLAKAPFWKRWRA